MAATAFDLVIRFSTSDADITIRIEDASITTALTLKQQIRAHVAEPTSRCRLRLIHAGKAIQDATALSQVLRHVPSQPSDTDEHGSRGKSKSAKAKGKQAIVNVQFQAPAARVYIHCSVGDVLSAAELAAEAKAAQEADEALRIKAQNDANANAPFAAGLQNEGTDAAAAATATTTTMPAPRGFERLLATGFTAAEVATLRTQFLAIQAHSHTPDTMPSGAELLALEEQWLDNTSDPAVGGQGGGGGSGAEDAGALEDMLYGNLIGFFWPMGAMFWLMREEGVWSRRKQISVLSGFLVNLTFGFLRILN